MNKQLIASICVLGLVGMVVGVTVQGADTGTVTATVTAGEISVTVIPTTFNYGTIPFGSSKESFDVIDESGNHNIKATVGTIETDIKIKGDNSTGGTGWILSTTSSAGQYIHAFGTGTNGTTKPGSYSALTNAYTTLENNVAANGSVWFGLKITTPTSGETAQQSAPIIVQASWSG